MQKRQSGGVGTVILFTFLVIAGIGWFYFQPRKSQESQQVQTTPSPVLDPTKNWKTHTSLNYTFKYPAEAKTEAREGGSVVSFMGQKQINSGRTQTELFDGYSFVIEKVVIDSNVTPEQQAKEEREGSVNNCNTEGGSVSQVKLVKVNGQTGYQYSVKGCYLDYTGTIVVYNKGTYRISQSYVGEPEDQKKYKEVTDNILSTLEFTD